MQSMKDYLTIYQQGQTYWSTACWITHAEGEMPDDTDASIMPAARTKVKVRYAPQLDAVLDNPGNFRAELARTNLPTGSIRSAIQDPRDRNCLMLEL